MDSPVINQLFKQLFAHRPCRACSRHATAFGSYGATQTRSASRRVEKSTLESSWQQRTDHFPQDKADEFKRYPMVTSDSMRHRKERPRRAKMLMRDFVEG